MKIIAFLGNPGKKYSRNRHNIGAIIGDIAAGHFGIKVKEKEFSAHTGAGKIAGMPVLLLFPQTYMNASGTSVQAALQYYREAPANLVVVHDEIELPFGEFRTKFGGGHKGHNGLRSIIQHTGSADFHRIRVGVGRPAHPETAVADHVLSDFTGEEMQRIIEMAPSIIEALAGIIAAE